MRGGFCKKAAANDMTSAAARSGQRGSNSLTAIPRMARRHSREPWLTSDWIAPPARGGGSEFARLLCHSKKKGHDLSSCPSFWSGQRGSNSLTAIPRMARRHSQDPWLTSDQIAPPARGWRQRVRRDSSSSQKEKDTLSDVLFLLERATRLELATSTLARWRSTR